MAVEITFSFESGANINLHEMTAATDIVSLSNGHVAVIGDQSANSGAAYVDHTGATTTWNPGVAGQGGAVATLSNGNVLLVRDIGSNAAFSITDQEGTYLLGMTNLSEGGPDLLNIDAAGLAGGTFAIAYQDYFGGSDSDIEINLRNNDGAEIKTISIDSSGADDQDPSIAALADGGFVVAWERNFANSSQLWTAVFNADGSVRRAAGMFDDFGTINRDPEVIALGNGGFAIVYEDNGWDGDSEITLARFDAQGVPAGVDRLTDNQVIDRDPSLTVLSNGMLLLGSSTMGANENFEPRWTLVDPSTGDVLHEDASLGGELDDTQPLVAAMADGRFAAIYNTGASDVHGQIMQTVRNWAGDDVDNTMSGDALRDLMFGNGGSDFLIGGGNADEMHGGAGNDFFNIGSGHVLKGEIIDGGADVDTIYALGEADFSLAQLGSIERLEFQNGDQFKLSPFGVTFAAGQIGAGLAGNLEVVGAIGWHSIDVVMGKATKVSLAQWTFSGFDDETTSIEIIGDGSAETIIGSKLDDFIRGGGGNDRLAGGGGLDALLGGGGNDIYTVNRAGEAREAIGGGIDTVRSSVDYKLGANLERLLLTGSADVDGGGNGLANLLTGNGGANALSGGAGNDRLNGGGGVDLLRGGLGNDRYTVNAAGEAREAAGQGTDTVISSVTYMLGANVERLKLSGAANINGKGNADANMLTGNDGANVLNGAGGKDVLIGGEGADSFLFNIAPGAANADKILDFEGGVDRIRLDDAVFTGLTNAGRGAAFHIGASAADASDRIIYNSETGALFFDADGKGGAAQVRIATLEPALDLHAADFLIV